MNWLFTMFLMLTLVFSGCLQSQTRKTVQYADALEKAINDFEEKRSETHSKVKETAEKATENLKNGDPIRKVAEDFEWGWKDVSQQIEDLEKKLSTVARASREYFEEMERIAAAIKDESMRDTEMARNQALKESWSKAFIKASQDIRGLERVRTKGHDFENLLRLSTLRKKVQENIGLLADISKEAESLLVRLEALVEEGKALAAADGGLEQRFALNER